MTNTEVKIQNNVSISEETIKKRTTDNLISPKVDNADNIVILNPVSWQTFNQLLQELGDKRNQRLAYRHETLEIMSPLGVHENNNRLIESLIFVTADSATKRYNGGYNNVTHCREYHAITISGSSQENYRNLRKGQYFHPKSRPAIPGQQDHG